MPDTLFDLQAQPWPAAALDSIYKLYPRKENRKAAIQRITEALDRIVSGEIDGAPRTQQQAIEYLRMKTEEARQEFAGREQKWIPHPTTFYNGRKYLRMKTPERLPENLVICIDILSCYPLMPEGQKIGSHVSAFLPALLAIEKAIRDIGAEPLLKRVCLYAHCVSAWPKEDLQFVPSAKRWMEERRYEQPEQCWTRRPINGHYESGRDQLRRLNQV